MTLTLVTTLPQKGGPDKDLVAGLERLLAEAKSGELQGIAFAAMYSTGEFKTDWDGTATCLPMLGAIAMLSYGFSHAIDSLPEED